MLRTAMQWYLSRDEKTKAILSALFSSILNVILGLCKLVVGVLFRSPWSVIHAVYYLLLCLGRGNALVKYENAVAHHAENEDEKQAEWESYRHSGLFLMLLGFSYLLISIRTYFRGEYIAFPDWLIFGYVIFCFVKLANGIYGIVNGIRLKSPLLSVTRIFSFADACVSLVVSRCALLLFTGQPNAVPNSALFGMVVSVLFFILGLAMSLRRHKEK